MGKVVHITVSEKTQEMLFRMADSIPPVILKGAKIPVKVLGKELIKEGKEFTEDFQKIRPNKQYVTYKPQTINHRENIVNVYREYGLKGAQNYVGQQKMKAAWYFFKKHPLRTIIKIFKNL